MLSLPIPISVNALYRKGRFGQIYKSKLGAKWLEDSAKIIRRHFPVFTTPITVKIYLHFRDKRRRDIDNLNKLIFDAIKFSGIVEDDCWAIIRRLEMEAYLGDGHLELEITPYDAKVG